MNIALRIRYPTYDYLVPHDDLVRIVEENRPGTLKTRSWKGEIYGKGSEQDGRISEDLSDKVIAGFADSKDF
jgi:hypothetical protein